MVGQTCRVEPLSIYVINRYMTARQKQRFASSATHVLIKRHQSSSITCTVRDASNPRSRRSARPPSLLAPPAQRDASATVKSLNKSIRRTGSRTEGTSTQTQTR